MIMEKRFERKKEEKTHTYKRLTYVQNCQDDST